MLDKNMPAFFPTLSHSFFIAIIRQILKAHFAWKQLKVDYSKIVEKRKIAGLLLFVPWPGTYQRKWIIKNCNSVGAWDHKVGKTGFGPTLTLFSPTFCERERCKLYIFKKVGLRVHSLVVSDLRSKTKGSQFEFGC